MEKETSPSPYFWAIAGIVISILVGVCPVTWWFKAILLCVVTLLIIYAFIGPGCATRWSKKQKIIFSIIVVIVMAGVSGYVVSEQWKIDHNIIFVSPKEITIVKHSTKNVVLSVTNARDHTLYDLCLGICVSDAELDASLIRITALEAELIIPPLILSNKCISIVFAGISGIGANTTKNCFNIIVDGTNLTKNVRVAFNIFSSATEPSLLLGRITKDHVKNPPKDLGEFFSDKIPPNDRTGSAIMQLTEFPINPYFPCEKTTILIGTYSN